MARTTLNKLAYDFIELYRANHKDTDSLSVRQVKDWIHSTRATLLKNRFDKNPFNIDESFIQSFGLVPMEALTIGNKDAVRSVSELPLTINRRGEGTTITRVSDTEYASNYEIVTKKRALNSGNMSFNSSEPYVFVHNDKLHIINLTLGDLTGDNIYVEGVAQNPEEVAIFIGAASFDSTYNYPIDLSMRNLMKNLIIKENFNFIVQQIEDKVSDSVDTTTK